MSNRLILFLLSLLLSAPVFSTDKDVEAISLQQFMLEQGEFEQEKYLSEFPMPLKSKGSFRFDEQDTLVWETREPIQQTLEINREKGLFIGEEKISDGLSGSVMQIFLALMRGDKQAIQDYFEWSEIEQEKIKIITLLPAKRQIKQAIKSIEIGLKEKVEYFKVFESNGDYIVIKLIADKK